MKKFSFFLIILHLMLVLSMNAQNNTWLPTKGPEGGAVHDLETHGNNLYACADTKIWKSSDQGNSWAPMNWFGESYTCIDMFVQGDLFIVLGLQPISGGASQIFRSIDAGVTWTEMVSPIDFNSFFPGFRHFVQTDGQKIWLGGRLSLLYASSDLGLSWQQAQQSPLSPDEHIFAMLGSKNSLIAFLDTTIRVSHDNGQTWQTSSKPNSWPVTNSASMGDTIFANYAGKSFVSLDFGSNWHEMEGLTFGFSEIKRNSNGQFATASGSICTSADLIHWVSQNQVLFFVGSCSYINNQLFCANRGGIFWLNQNTNQLVASNSGFTSLNVLDIATTSSGFIHSVVEGSLFKSTDEGYSWTRATLLAYQVEYFNNAMFITTSDGIYRQPDGSTQWELVKTINPFDPTVTILKVTGSELWYINPSTETMVTNDGINWNSKPVLNGILDIIRTTSNTLLFTFYDGVFRSTDNGDTYQLIHPVSNSKQFLRQEGNLIIHMVDNFLWHSTDDGVMWTQISPTGFTFDPFAPFSPRILSLESNQNVLIASFAREGLYASFDKGYSWQNFNGQIPTKYGRKVHTHGNKLYYGGYATSVWVMNTQFNSVSGMAFNDADLDGVLNNGEAGSPNIIIQAKPINSTTSTISDGTFNIIAGQDDTLRALTNSPYKTAVPGFILNGQLGGNLQFAIQSTPNIQDIRVDVASNQPMRPGFNGKITVLVKNLGTVISQPALVTISLPPGVSYLSATTTNGIQVLNQNGILSWSVSGLALEQYVSAELELGIDASVPLNTQLSFSAIATLQNDYNQADNSSTLVEQVVGSYDPNDKLAAPYIHPDDLNAGKAIEYTIRFENTGTFYAQFIVIKDTIEANLDISTFQFIGASHECDWRILNDNVLVFTLDSIFLEPTETGFVKFSIAGKRGLQVNTKLQNKAGIYFDFNPPNITNIATTTVAYPLWVDALDFEYEIKLTPNLANQNTKIELISAGNFPAGMRVRMFDTSGKLVKESNFQHGQQIDVSSLPQGMYRVHLATPQGITSKTIPLTVQH